jgi:hypothetical protein
VEARTNGARSHGVIIGEKGGIVLAAIFDVYVWVGI